MSQPTSKPRRFSLPRPNGNPLLREETDPGLPPFTSSFSILHGGQPRRPLNSLQAAASMISSTPRFDVSKAQGWQEDAWDMFDLVGEERFLATTLANRVSQARLFVGKYPENDTEEIVPLESGTPVDVFDAFGGSPSQRGQLIGRQALSLFIAGDGSFIGIPKAILDYAEERKDDTIIDVPPMAEGDLDVNDLVWRQFSVTEVSQSKDEVTINLTAKQKIKCKASDLYGIRNWRPHPRRFWDADSPTRSSLPVLRELVGLTMHISAQVDSRLAGAGVFVVPESAKRSLAYQNDDDNEDSDPFTTALIEAMITPITDRASASAVVPLVITVPDESVGKFEHITFSTPLDKEARQMREEAIRRLALGQDAPPEILLGVGGMNHWGAWLVREDTITTHIEPPLALICDALTTQYLWPVLQQQENMSAEEAQKYVIWYDVDHLIMRPNKTADAFALYDLDEITGDSLRKETGFGEDDAPDDPIEDPATQAALKLAESNPSLIQNPGLPVLIDQYKTLYAGKDLELPPPPEAFGLPGEGDGKEQDEESIEDATDEETPPDESADGPPSPDKSPIVSG